MGDVSPIEQEGVNSPEELRTAAMKEMAGSILAEARRMVDSYRLEQDPKKPGTSFAHIIFGTEGSLTAQNLKALSEGQKPPNVEECERNIAAAQTPEQKARLEQNRELLARTIGMTFSYIQAETGLATRFGNRADQIADGLTSHFLRVLGFLEEGKALGDPQSPSSNVERHRNEYTVTHPTKPFVAECHASGSRSDWWSSGPRFEGFALRYTTTPQTPQSSQP